MDETGDSTPEGAEDFKAPKTGEEAQTEKQEQLTERFVESPEMFELRQTASDTIESLRETADGAKGGFPLTRDSFIKDFLDPYKALGEQALASVNPKNREVAELELAVYAALFQVDCGFRNNGQKSLELLTYKFDREQKPDLTDKLHELFEEIDGQWVMPTKVELQVPQERIDQFLQGVSIKAFGEGEGQHGQLVNCPLQTEMS